MPIKHEHLEQCALFRVAAIKAKTDPRWGMLYANANAGGYTGGYKKNLRRVMSMRAEGVRPGVPDIFLAVPSSDYHGLYIEMKHGSNKLSPEQEGWARRLGSFGYLISICYSAQEAIDTIAAYLRMAK